MLKKRVGNVKRQRTATHAQNQSQANQRPARPKAQPDYEKLGKLLFAIGETGTKNRRKLYKIAFWKGVWSGLGGVVGATIVVSILLFVFNALGSVPLIGEFIDVVEQSVPSNSVE